MRIAGAGQVSSTDKVYRCGNKCYGVYPPGATVTLSARPASGSVFTRWGGGGGGGGGGGATFTLAVGKSSGSQPSCTVTLNADAKALPGFST